MTRATQPLNTIESAANALSVELDVECRREVAMREDFMINAIARRPQPSVNNSTILRHLSRKTGQLPASNNRTMASIIP